MTFVCTTLTFNQWPYELDPDFLKLYVHEVSRSRPSIVGAVAGHTDRHTCTQTCSTTVILWLEAILRGWVISRLNFRLKGYVLCQYRWTIRWRNGCITTLPLEVSTQRNFVADFVWLKLKFVKKTQQKLLFEPPFGGLMCNVHSPALKAVVNFLFVIIELFSLSVTVETKSAFFEGGGWVGHIEYKFKMEGASHTNHCWCHKTRVIVLSCGIKIIAVHCLILSQSLHVMDRQTDWITTPKTALA